MSRRLAVLLLAVAAAAGGCCPRPACCLPWDPPVRGVPIPCPPCAPPVPSCGGVWAPAPRRACQPVPRGELYAGVLAAALPGLGAGIEAGQVFHRSDGAAWSFELSAAGQDLSLFGDAEEMAQLRGGLKASLCPRSSQHTTFRGGLTWFRVIGDPEGLPAAIDREGDYFGVYVGAGYEWEIGRHFRTGPEAALTAAVIEKGDFDLAFVPQVFWHFTYEL